MLVYEHEPIPTFYDMKIEFSRIENGLGISKGCGIDLLSPHF